MHARSPHESNRSLRMPRLTWLLAAFAVGALAPALTGCEIPLAMALADDMGTPNEPSPDPYYDDGYYDGYGSESAALQVKDAQVHGDLGEAIGFSGPAQSVDAYDSGGFTSVTLWANGKSSTNWATMTAISISNGGLGSDVFKPGAKLHFSSEDYDAVPYVYTWGCSGTGADADMLDYESGTSDTDIEVSEAADPGMLHLTFKVTYLNYNGSPDQIVEGELDIAAPVPL